MISDFLSFQTINTLQKELKCNLDYDAKLQNPEFVTDT